MFQKSQSVTEGRLAVFLNFFLFEQTLVNRILMKLSQSILQPILHAESKSDKQKQYCFFARSEIWNAAPNINAKYVTV